MSKMRVLFIPTLNSGVTYWRMYNYWKAAYENHAFNSHLMWWQKNITEAHPWQVEIEKPEFYARVINELDGHIREADVIVMGHSLTSSAFDVFECIRTKYKKPILTEMDDCITSIPSYNPAVYAYSPNALDDNSAPKWNIREMTIKQLRKSDGLIVSTPYLKELYSEYNENISVIPNCIDFDVWGKGNKAKNKKLRIGWAGGAAHNEDLEIVLPAIKNILKKRKDVEFAIVHGIPPSFKNIKNIICVNKFTRIDKYPQFIKSLSFDIGIAPLVDNTFNRAKSNLRFLEYGALGIPCIASPVGHFAETITHGMDGILSADNEWERYLTDLIESKTGRIAIGKNAREKIKFDFNVNTVIWKYKNALETALNQYVPKQEAEHELF